VSAIFTVVAVVSFAVAGAVYFTKKEQ